MRADAASGAEEGRRPSQLGHRGVVREWEPNQTERSAAWELYVELITRVSVVPLPEGDVLLREALTSLYSVFETTRGVLRKYGPDIAEPKPDGQFNFAYLAVTILNTGIRPLLARWHPALTHWEQQCPPGLSPAAHEQAWPAPPTCAPGWNRPSSR